MARQEDKERDQAEMKRIGRRVRQARQARGLTLDQAAEAAETSSQFLSQLERGGQSMTMVKFARVAKALGVSSDYLLYGAQPNETTALAAEFLGSMAPIERDILARNILQFRRLLDDISSGHG